MPLETMPQQVHRPVQDASQPIRGGVLPAQHSVSGWFQYREFEKSLWMAIYSKNNLMLAGCLSFFVAAETDETYIP